MSLNILQLETCLISASPYTGPSSDSPIEVAILAAFNAIHAGQYADVLVVPYIAENLLNFSDLDDEWTEDPFTFFRQKVEDFLLDDSSSLRQLLILLTGIAYFNIFLQNNWTGPSTNPPNIYSKLSKQDSIEALSLEGEEFYKHVVCPQYLQAANVILVDMVEDLTELKSRYIWTGRCSLYHQQCLLGPVDKLRRVAETSYQKSVFAFPIPATPEDVQKLSAEEKKSLREQQLLSARVELEYGLLYSHYKSSFRALEHFKQAMRATGLRVQLSGALGKRTKYQTFDTSQLVVLARSNTELDPLPEGGEEIPETVENLDPSHVALEKIQYVKDMPDAHNNMATIDQAIMLALCLFVKNENPRHGLIAEEMWAYIERVLKNPNNWLIHSMALLLKSRIEVRKSKTVDRACMQIEVLVNQFDSDLEREYSPAVRMMFLHSLSFPPKFKLSKELGKHWLTIGSVDSALLIFNQLEMWEEIINCYVARNDKEKAKTLIREQLAVKESPELLCILGDLTKELEHYERAWTVSRGRCPRAKRSLGIACMAKLDFEAAIAHFEVAVKINPQYASIWFRMGCCALGINDLTRGQRCFSRVVQLYPEDSEAWNNLAAVYIKQGKKKEAFKALKESLKNKNDNWKVWENFVLVAIDTCEFSEAIKAMEEMMAIKEENPVDIEALTILIQYAIEDIKSGQEYLGNFIHAKLKNLLDKIQQKVSEDPKLWDIFARYWRASGDLEKAVEYRTRQIRAVQKVGWEDTLPMFKEVVSVSTSVVSDSIAYNNKSQLYSIKLLLTNCVKKSENSFEGTEEHNQLKANLQELTETYNQIA
eukprot:TRINITY_DN642_c0_g1_i3.p1 TRINITY_DN642_c0_g1~~TRINITY_DN642_c0_g1_i3.p1  ORF type:complete len:821 (+),score=202.87 TRINITY_DN642_c0_g1_i3:19-2481(+)